MVHISKATVVTALKTARILITIISGILDAIDKVVLNWSE